MSDFSTQAGRVLRYLKGKGQHGATAMELVRLYIPQYNWCIWWLRNHGHKIASVRQTGDQRWRFFYKGKVRA